MAAAKPMAIHLLDLLGFSFFSIQSPSEELNKYNSTPRTMQAATSTNANCRYSANKNVAPQMSAEKKAARTVQM